MSPIVAGILILLAAAVGWGQRVLDRRPRSPSHAEDVRVELSEARATLPAASRQLPPGPGGVRLRDGVACLLAFVAAQGVVWLIIGMVAAARAGIGSTRTARLTEVVRLVPVGLLVGEGAAALALALVLRRLGRRISWRVLKSELGLAWGPLHTNLVAGAGGMALAGVSIVSARLEAAHGGLHPHLMTFVLAHSAAARLAWTAVVVLMAGPAEEVLFRGVVLAGLRTRVRLSVAALAAGFAFWLMHYPNVVDSWTAAASIAVFATYATLLRLRTRAVGPAITAHVANNLLLSMLLLRAV